MVASSLDEYIDAGNRFEKSLVIHRIVDQIQAEGGRFLKKDTREEKWSELTQQQSKEKVGHAIRDAANLYLSRQQKAETRASVEPLGSGHNQEAPLKSPPSYAEVGQSSTERVSLPTSAQHSFEAEAAAFDSQFSSHHFMQSPIERTTPQRLITAGNVANPFELSIAQTRGRNRQSDMTQSNEYRHQQAIHRRRQQVIAGDQSSRLPAHMTHTGILNLSDPQNVRQLQPSLPMVPQELGFGSLLSAQSGVTTSNRASSSFRQQQMTIPYPPSTTTAARAFDPYDRIQRDQMLLQQSTPNLHYQQQSQQHHDRIDDNDHFLDVINAVLGPIGHDTEDDIIATGESSASDIPQPILFETQLEHQQQSQLQYLPEENVEEDRKPSPKDRR